MDVWVVVFVSFCASKYDLKRKTPRWHGSNSDSHGVEKLAMVFTVIMRVLAPHPAFEMRDVTL
jgi:hypothetical protein